MKIQILLFFLFCHQISELFAQTSPIFWKSNSYNINIDTTSNKEGTSRALEFTFINKGDHVTFVDFDSLNYDRRDYVTKPNESSTISLRLYDFNLDTYRKKKNTTAVLSLPFYYDGKIFKEKVTCQLTFGKSKLIKHNSFYFDASDTIAQLAKAGKQIQFTHYFTITNIGSKTIFCTKSITVWNDAGGFYNYGKFEVIPPGRSYKIPVEINMDRKFNFMRTGNIEVYAEGISEIHNCKISSHFTPTR